MDVVSDLPSESLTQSLFSDHGAVVIKDCLSEIVEMLLPAGYSLISSTTMSSGEAHGTEEESLRSVRAQSMSPESPSKPPSSILGPAWALRILAQNSEYSAILCMPAKFSSCDLI